MGYENINGVLEAWAKRNKLYLYKEYKEIEVCSVDIVSEKGRQSQIWIDPLDSEGLTGIHVWDFKKKRRDFLVSAIDFEEYLENALRIAKSWIK